MNSHSILSGWTPYQSSILVHRDRGDPEEESAEDHSNDTGNPTEDTKDNTPVSFIEIGIWMRCLLTRETTTVP